jgi:hypothetical protein
MNVLWIVSVTGLAAFVASSLSAQSTAPPAPRAQPPTPTLVIRNGTLIDGTGKPPVEGATIVISGDRITRVATGEVTPPTGVRVIDAGGLAVLPGLMDMHIHHRPWMWRLFLQFGVTTIRDVGSDPDLILRERERERRGELAAPRIFACGPLLDGDPPVWPAAWRGSWPLRSEEQARAAAQRLLDRGVDCLKVYSRLPSPLMRAIVELASVRGVPVTGHLGTVSARDAAEMGVDAIEHASGIGFPMPSEVQEQLIRVLVERGTFIVPTLLVGENFANLPSILHRGFPARWREGGCGLGHAQPVRGAGDQPAPGTGKVGRFRAEPHGRHRVGYERGCGAVAAVRPGHGRRREAGGPGAGGGQPGQGHYHHPKRACGDQGRGCGVRTAVRRGAAWRVAGGMGIPLTVHAVEPVACRRPRTA